MMTLASGRDHELTSTAASFQIESQTSQGAGGETHGPTGLESHEGRILEELSLVESQIRENKRLVLKAALRQERIELLRRSMQCEAERANRM